MRRVMLVGACIALGAFLAVFAVPREQSAALANEPSAGASMEETYAGWTWEQLRDALEQRKSLALARKDALLDERFAQGEFEESFEPGQPQEAPLALPPRADAVAVRVDNTPAGDGRIVRTAYILLGQDPELDRLVEEIEYLTARAGSSADE